MPQNEIKWDELPIKKIFAEAGKHEFIQDRYSGEKTTYEEGMEKLVIAEDTSNVDDMSSDTLREHKKQKRRQKVKRMMSSSSDEDVFSDVNNHVKQTPVKVLPAFPQINNFVSSSKKQLIQKSIQANPKSVLRERNTMSGSYIMSESGKTSNPEIFPSTRNYLIEKSGDNIENSFTCEYKKISLGKLNKILFKLTNIENKMDILEDKIQSSNYTDQEKEILTPLPISTLDELTVFEKQLQDVRFRNEMIHTLKLVGGNTAHIMIRNILKRVITDTVAKNFSWAGKKTKRRFQDLSLARIITQIVHMYI